MNYSIIIPIFNEQASLTKLLSELYIFSSKNEIILINDGSTDSSKDILKSCKYIKLINLDKNQGKGKAIAQGIKVATYDKIIITDGDLELKTEELKNMMIFSQFW